MKVSQVDVNHCTLVGRMLQTKTVGKKSHYFWTSLLIDWVVKLVMVRSAQVFDAFDYKSSVRSFSKHWFDPCSWTHALFVSKSEHNICDC